MTGPSDDDTDAPGAADGPGAATNAHRHRQQPTDQVAVNQVTGTVNAVDGSLPEITQMPANAGLAAPKRTPAVPPARRADDTVLTRRQIVDQFSTFYRERSRSLVVYLRHLGASWDDAADVAQETMRKAFEQWATLRDPVSWTRLVATRDWTTRAARRREDPTSDHLDAGHPLLPHRDELAELDSRLELLGYAVDLPPRQREVLAATYDGATPAEIANDLTISPEAVRSSLRHARSRLAASLPARPAQEKATVARSAAAPEGQDPRLHRSHQGTLSDSTNSSTDSDADTDQGGRP